MIEAELPCEFPIGGSCLIKEFPHLLLLLVSSLPIGLLNQKLALTPGSDQ
jgi:hypothetical protein